MNYHDPSTVGAERPTAHNDWNVPVCVEVQAYLRFSRRMDSQLRRLVARWACAATPQSRGAAPPGDISPT